ncbi:hypothetical protein AB0D33_36000 [Streptomyces sp. NPDC048404]|uniref:hypothetical protein n=1 Tax=unclassified Streptomyces TaxID=2593676 RepID=UPI003446F215
MARVVGVHSIGKQTLGEETLRGRHWSPASGALSTLLLQAVRTIGARCVCLP